MSQAAYSPLRNQTGRCNGLRPLCFKNTSGPTQLCLRFLYMFFGCVFLPFSPLAGRLGQLLEDSIGSRPHVSLRCCWAQSLFLVGESKSFAGREAREKGDAIGRPIAVSWFEKHRDLAQGPFYSVLGTVGVFAPIVAAWLVCSRSFLVCGYFTLGPGAFVTREHLRS